MSWYPKLNPGDPLMMSPSPLRALRAAWALRASKPVNIVILGDSVTQGYYATTFDQSLVAILMARLCQANGQPVAGGYANMSTNVTGSYTGRNWTIANGTDTSNYGIGYAATTLASNTPGPVGTATTSYMCDRLWVHYPIAASGLGTFTIAIDGGGPVTITPTGTARTGVVWDSGQLTRDIHTVAVAANSATAAVVEGATFFDGNGNTAGTVGTLSAANANTGAGLRLFNAAHFGFKAISYAAVSGAGVWWTDAFDTVNPDAVFIFLGVNDCSTRTTAQYHDDLTTVIARIATACAAYTILTPSIVVCGMYGVGATDLMPPYRVVARQVAAEQQVAYIDWYDMVGYVGTATADIYSLMSSIDPPTGKIHPSNVGHQMLGDSLSEFVTTALGPTGQLPRTATRRITTAGRQVADGVLASSTTVTSATAAFVAGAYPTGDIGRVISSIGIPRGTTITARASGTSITISAAATITAGTATLALAAPITAIDVTLDDVLLVNATACAQELLMPSPVSQTGQTITVKKTDDTSNPVILYVASPALIEGGAEFEIRDPRSTYTFLADGTNWWAL
jgi:lysophospholipase L1-like esterase